MPLVPSVTFQHRRSPSLSLFHLTWAPLGSPFPRELFLIGWRQLLSSLSLSPAETQGPLGASPTQQNQEITISMCYYQAAQRLHWVCGVEYIERRGWGAIPIVYLFLLKYSWFGASIVTWSVKILPAMQETWFDSWVGKISWRRKWQPALVFLPGESHRQKSLAGFSPCGHKSRTQLSD